MTATPGTLEERLRETAMREVSRDGYCSEEPVPITRDGPAAADEIASLRARAEAMAQLLEGRDAFIVRWGLWDDFVDSTRQALDDTPTNLQKAQIAPKDSDNAE